MNSSGRVLVRPRFLKWSLFVLFLLSPFVSHAACDYAESRRLAGIVSQIRDAHEPTTVWEATRGHYLSGDFARSARYYRAAAALGASTAGGNGPVWSTDGAEALSYLDRAAPLPFDGFGGSEPIAALMTLTQNFATKRTRELAEKGDGSGAVRSLYSTVRLVRVLEPAFGWSGSITYRVVDDLEFMLSHCRVDTDLLVPLAAELAEIDRDDLQKQQLVRQRAFLLDSVGKSASWLMRPVVLRATNSRLEQMRQLIDRASLPWPRRLGAESIKYSWWDGLPFNNERMRLSMRDSDEYGFVAAANTAARIRAARVAIAAERYRDVHQAWPSDASSLVPDFLPAIPIDPFRGEPMRTIADGSGFVAYSVGLNNRDERGTLMKNAGIVRPGVSRAMAEGDIGVRIPPH